MGALRLCASQPSSTDPQVAESKPKNACPRREASAYLPAAVKDAFAHGSMTTQAGQTIAEMAISSAQTRLRKAKTVAAKKITKASLARQAGSTAAAKTASAANYF